MTAEMQAIIEECDAQGVRPVLNADGLIELTGTRPDDRLRTRLRQHKEALRECLEQHNPFRGRWGEVPTGTLRYRSDPPALSGKLSVDLLDWLLRQPFPTHKWVADRANAYYARSPHWTQEQMDQSAMMDLHKWQTGHSEFVPKNDSK